MIRGGESRYRRRAATALFLWAAMVSTAAARTHLVYEFDRSRGLPANAVHNLVQDRSGMIWIGGSLALFRYDGREFVRWNDAPLAGNPEGFADDRVEGLIVKLEFPSRELFRVVPGGLQPYAPDIDPPLDKVRDIVAGEDGSLWIADAVGLRHRDGSGRWRTVPASEFEEVAPHRLRAIPGSGVLAMTRQHLWRVLPDGGPDHLATARSVITAAEQTADGRIFYAFGGPPGGTLAELVDGEPVVRAAHRGRSTDLVVRGEAVWVAFDVALLRWHPAQGTEVISREGGFYTGGGRFVLDHEGSLWIGGFANLVQLPEPSSSVWTPADGLADDSGTWVTAGADGIWTSSYDGLSLIRNTGSRRSGTIVQKGFSPYRVCSDGDGRIWHPRRVSYTDPLEILESKGDHLRIHRLPPGTGEGTCTRARDGRVWITRGQDLFKSPAGGGPPVRVGRLPVDGPVQSAHETVAGELWLGYFGKTCRAAVDRIVEGPAAWRCVDDDRITWSRSMVETADGGLWIDSSQGLFRSDGESWQAVSGVAPGNVRQLVASPRGGFWAAGLESIVRVEPDDRDPARVRTVERLSQWQGLPSEAGTSIVEQDDGTVWVATRRGLIQLPPEVRDQALPVPRVQLVSAWADDEPLDLAGGAELPADRNRVEVRFAAMSYRNPGLIRYRVRSGPADRWNETRTPEFRFVGLSPGEYRPEVAASLDGVNWSEQPARFSFTVLAPWYRTGWAMTLFAATLAAGLFAAYRVRLAIHLRAERQRTRIAMDLHDEMGSGLGSIGILSSVLEDEGLDPRSRAGIVRQIGQTAEELGLALADIVWSLRPRARTLGAVLERVEKLARRLLPHPQAVVTLETVPDHETVFVSQPVCKNVLSIAGEALHNAARHGRPKKVAIALERTGRRWRIRIDDDGVGFDPQRLEGDGLGLHSMKRRAGDIGASLNVESREGRGTRVHLVFDPGAGDRRLAFGRPHDHADGRRGGSRDTPRTGGSR